MPPASPTQPLLSLEPDPSVTNQTTQTQQKTKPKQYSPVLDIEVNNFRESCTNLRRTRR
jgi:hypothetical protein